MHEFPATGFVFLVNCYLRKTLSLNINFTSLFQSCFFFLLVDMKTLQRKTFDHRRMRKIRNRWQLFVTLHNNPSLREHRRSELFVERSAFAAFGIMVQRGVVQFSDTTIDKERDGKFDTNL